jgi:hypothetical protein
VDTFARCKLLEYSLNTPQRVTVQCQETGSPPKYESNSQVFLEGTGILPNSSSCYVQAESFKLLPHSLGKTEVQLNRAHIVLPILENVLQFSETIMLQPNMVSPINLQRLDDISTQISSRNHMRGADVTRLINTLLDADEGRQRQQVSWLWIMILIFVSIPVGSLWPVWLKCISVLLCFFEEMYDKRFFV